MFHILAMVRVTRDKLYDYYYNGLEFNDVKREKENTLTYYQKINYFLSSPELIYKSDNGIELYLGNSFNAANYYTLEENKIECIINASQEVPNYFPELFCLSKY